MLYTSILIKMFFKSAKILFKEKCHKGSQKTF